MKNFFKTLLLSLALTMSVSAFSKEILKVYIATPPGGFNDVMLRKLQSLTPENSKFQVQVEYRPGGEGLISLNSFLADRSPHALLFVGLQLINKVNEDEKHLQEFQSLVPAAYLYEFGTTFVSGNNSQFKTWNDVMAEAASGRPLNIGAATASIARIAQGYFAKYPNVQIIPFSGDRPALTAILSDTVPVAHLTNVGAQAPVSQNQVRGLIVTYGPSVAGTPTASQYKTVFPYLPLIGGFSARKGTPKDVVDEYNKFLTTISNHPEMLEFYQKNTVSLPRNTSGENFERVLDRVKKEASNK